MYIHTLYSTGSACALAITRLKSSHYYTLYSILQRRVFFSPSLAVRRFHTQGYSTYFDPFLPGVYTRA